MHLWSFVELACSLVLELAIGNYAGRKRPKVPPFYRKVALWIVKKYRD